MNSILNVVCVGISMVSMCLLFQLLQESHEKRGMDEPKRCTDSATVIGTPMLRKINATCEPRQTIETQELEFGSVLVLCRCEVPSL